MNMVLMLGSILLISSITVCVLARKRVLGLPYARAMAVAAPMPPALVPVITKVLPSLREMQALATFSPVVRWWKAILMLAVE